MKQNMSLHKVAYASLTLFISAPHVVTAMSDSQPLPEITDSLQKPIEKQAYTGQLRDHEYYKAELQKLEESTRRIHEEVDKILKEFRENMKKYYLLTRGVTASVMPETAEKEKAEKGEQENLAKKEGKSLIKQLGTYIDEGSFASAFKALKGYQQKYPKHNVSEARKVIEDAMGKSFLRNQQDGEAGREQNAKELLKLVGVPEMDADIKAARHCLKVFEDKNMISDLLKMDTKFLSTTLETIKIFQVNHIDDVPTYEKIGDLHRVTKIPGEEEKSNTEEEKLKQVNKLDIERNQDILIAVARYIHKNNKAPGGVVKIFQFCEGKPPMPVPYQLKPGQSFNKFFQKERKLDEFLKDYGGEKTPGSIIVFDTMIGILGVAYVGGPYQYTETVEKKEAQPEEQSKEEEEQKKLAKEELIAQLEDLTKRKLFFSAFKVLENFKKNYPKFKVTLSRERIENGLKGGLKVEGVAQDFLKFVGIDETDTDYIKAARHCLNVHGDKGLIPELLKEDVKLLSKALEAIKIFQVNSIMETPTYDDISNLVKVIKISGEEDKKEKIAKIDINIKDNKDILIAVAMYIDKFDKTPGGVIKIIGEGSEGELPTLIRYPFNPSQSSDFTTKLDDFLKTYDGEKTYNSIIVFDTMTQDEYVRGPHQYLKTVGK